MFAVAFVIVLVAKRGGTSNEIDGVTQDGSGRRVIAVDRSDVLAGTAASVTSRIIPASHPTAT